MISSGVACRDVGNNAIPVRAGRRRLHMQYFPGVHADVYGAHRREQELREETALLFHTSHDRLIPGCVKGYDFQGAG